MAVAFKAAGGFFSGASGVFVSMPAGGSAPSAGDVILIVTESCNTASTAGTPVIDPEAGYSQITISTQGAGGAGVTTLGVWAKRAVGGDSGVWITGSPNHISGEAFVYSGCMLTGTPWLGGSTNGANSGNGTMTGLNTIKDNSAVVMICTSTRDAASSAQFSSWANANLTSINEREDETVLLGAGGGFGVAEGFLATAGASGNSTVTIATSEQWRSIHVALAPHTSQTYEDAVTLAKIDSVSETNIMTMLSALTLSSVKTVSDGNIATLPASLTLARVETITPTNVMTLLSALTLAEKEGITVSNTAVISSLLSLGRIEAIVTLSTVTTTIVATKGYITVIDFSANPVTATSYKANSTETGDFASSSVETDDF
jgi:hypothetical protein